MPLLAKHLVLGQPETVDRAHENAPLSGQVAVDLLLEGGLEQEAAADGDPQSDAALPGAPGEVLVNGEARVDAAPLEKEPPHRGA